MTSDHDRLRSDLAMNVVSDAGTELQVSANLGRVLVSTADHQVGTVVFREDPLMVWSDGWIDMVHQFEKLSGPDRESVMDMYHPPLDHSSVDHLGIDVRHIARESGTAMEAKRIHKLMAVANMNAHQYYGTNDVRYSEIATGAFGSMQMAGGKSALFLYGSKVAHSCEPNCSYTSKTHDGRLEYKVIRPIKTGDFITFSYIDDLYESSTVQRRFKLQESKAFFCKCDRCQGSDTCRLFVCKICEKTASCKYDDSQHEFWSCSGCDGVGPTEQDIDQFREMEIDGKHQLAQLDMSMQMNISMISPGMVEELVDRFSRSLCPSHFLTIKARGMLVRLCASKAAHLEEFAQRGAPKMVMLQIYRREGKPSALRKKAGTTAIKMILACECAAAGCDGNKCMGPGALGIVHEPVYEMTQTAFHAYQDFKQCGLRASSWPPIAVQVLRRYLPFVRILWGNEDPDVMEVEQALNSATTKLTAPAAAASAGTSNKKANQKRRTNNKKKGRGRR